MNNALQNHLTIKQAARVAGCSTKTLYRLMNRGVLAYQRGTNDRRYIDPEALRMHFNLDGEEVSCGSKGQGGDLSEKIGELITAIDRQSQLLECMIALYQPKTLNELATKQSLQSTISAVKSYE